MKVLHVYNQHRGGGGANNSTQTTIDVLRQHGVEVEVFTKSSKQMPATAVGRMKAMAEMLSGRGSISDFLERLNSYRPDVVHVHEIYPMISPWIVPACRQRGVPVVMTCVDYRLTCPIVTHVRNGQVCTSCSGGNEYWAVVRNCRSNLAESGAAAAYTGMVRALRLYRDNVSRFIAPSQFTRRWLNEQAKIDLERIATVFPVVDIPEEEVDPAKGEYIAYAGRLVPEKGILTIQQAADLSGLPFKMARDQNSIATVSLGDSAVEVVVTHGHDDLYAFLRRARIVVVPSLWFESFGLTAAEAMGHGLPAVVSRIGAIADLVEDGVNGFHFEPGNARELAEKVERIWRDPELCRRMGHAARQKAISSWTADLHFQSLKAVYDGVCK